MSSFWSGFIIFLAVGNIIAYIVLLQWTSKKPEEEPQADGTTGHSWDGITEYNNPLPRWWLWMFYLAIAFGFGYLALYPGLGSFAGYLGWTQEGRYQDEVALADAKFGELYRTLAARPIEELAQDPSALLTGQRLFANNCSVCHGSDARGAKGYPNLADDEWLYGGDPASIKTSILNGRHGVMPAWGAMLGEQGVEQVAAYVYSLNGRQAPAHLTEPGKARYAATCAACHGPEGKGMPALGAPDLTDRVWLYGGSLNAIKESIRNGREGIMPAHKDLLGEDRVHLIAAYVYSLSNKGGKTSEQPSR